MGYETSMNDILRAIILGVVEGLTEFLPISSTGHMILVMPLLGIHESDPSFHFWNGAFDIFIQLGAILAVAIYFWRRLWRLTFKSAGAAWTDHILFKLFIAFLPAAVVGLVAADRDVPGIIERHWNSPTPTAREGGVAAASLTE